MSDTETTQTLSFEHDYPVPPERLFRAWTDVAILSRWFGCGPGMLWKIHTWDARPGGAIHVSLDFPEGPFNVHGAFVEVDAPHRLTYRWMDEAVEVTIEPRGAGSRMRVVHAKIPADRDPAIQTGGWTCALDTLTRIDL